MFPSVVLYNYWYLTFGDQRRVYHHLAAAPVYWFILYGNWICKNPYFVIGPYLTPLVLGQDNILGTMVLPKNSQKIPWLIIIINVIIGISVIMLYKYLEAEALVGRKQKSDKQKSHIIKIVSHAASVC